MTQHVDGKTCDDMSRTSSKVLTASAMDLASAALTALSISPAVCLIDNAIASRVATGRPIFAYATHILRCPHTLLRNLLTSPAGRYVYVVYFSTFAAANLADSVLTRRRLDVADHNTARLVKFAVVTGVSTTATVWKDVRLARCFTPPGRASTTVPIATMGLFVARDCVTIFSSFTLPPLVARQMIMCMENEAHALKAAQLILPMAAQLITTPIHLTAYYLHYDPSERGLWRRVRQVGGDLSSAVPIRMLRILPAMGAGNLLNTSLREHFMVALKLNTSK